MNKKIRGLSSQPTCSGLNDFSSKSVCWSTLSPQKSRDLLGFHESCQDQLQILFLVGGTSLESTHLAFGI